MQKVNDWVDIAAPCQEVFDILVAVERRMQLSPLWGLSKLLGVSSNFPQAGSSYRVQVQTDVPFGIAEGGGSAVQGALAGLAQVMLWKVGHEVMSTDEPLSLSGEDAQPSEAPAQKPVVEAEQEYVVSEYEPPHKFSYSLAADCQTIITWRLQNVARGTRLSYEEVFCPENTGGEDFLPTVRHVVHEWLLNIKRYSELRGTRGRVLLRRLLDRFFLKLRPDQRRAVLLVLFMQSLALVTFVIAAVSLGIAGLFF